MEQKNSNAFSIESPAFKHGGKIPPEYTCEGANISPEITWSNVPHNTESLVLIVDDPDAPNKTWVHWVVYNIPESVKKLPRGTTEIGMEGMNDFGALGYGGPCPPHGHGIHHYNFTLYALNSALPLESGATKEDVMKIIKNHIIESTTLIGTYQRG